MLKFLPNTKYIIVDIPPALFISQTHLSNAYNKKKIFFFRPFNTFEEVENEFYSSEIIFLMPDQLDLLPNKIVDLFLAIDCLHEMKKKQVQSYFDQVNRLAKHFYFKCWEKTIVPFDGITHLKKDYPIKSNWDKIYKEKCEVPSEYFEALYQIK